MKGSTAVAGKPKDPQDRVRGSQVQERRSTWRKRNAPLNRRPAASENRDGGLVRILLEGAGWMGSFSTGIREAYGP